MHQMLRHSKGLVPAVDVCGSVIAVIEKPADIGVVPQLIFYKNLH